MPYLSVSVERNPIFRNHVSVHADKDTSRLARPFKCAYDELRSIDGIDDFANLVGQILPKVGQSIATLGIVLPATPFVAMGALGAIADANEHLKKTYPGVILEIARNENAILEQLQREGMHREEMAGVRANLHAAMSYLHANGSDRLRYQLDQFERANSYRSTARLDRNASLFGAVGMTGMTTGMFPLMGQAVAGIVENSADQLTAQGLSLAQGASAAGASAGALASSIFLGSQIFMAAKGVADSRSGHKKNAALSSSSASIEQLANKAGFANPVLSQASDSSKELIAAKRNLIKHHSISAGSLLAAGQSLMAIGSAATLTGTGAGVGIACAAIGAPLTMIAAGQQVIYRKKEARTLGADASQSAQEQKLDLLSVVEQQGLGKAIDVAANQVLAEQDDVIRSKLQSLVQHVIEAEMKSGKPHTEYSRMLAVESLAGNAKKSALTGTTLLKGDIAKLKPMLRDYYVSGLFKGGVMHVQHRLNVLAAERFIEKKLALSDSHGTAILKNTVRDVAKDKRLATAEKGAMSLAPGQRRKEVDSRQMFDAAFQSARVNNILARHMTKGLIAQTKTDSKFLRHDAVNALSAVSTTANGRSA